VIRLAWVWQRHTNMKNDAVKGRMQDTLAQLKTLRDEIRVDLHLAGMDLRDEWSQLEKRLPDAGATARLREVTQEAVESLNQELRAFKSRLRAPHPTGELQHLMTHAPVTCAPAETLAQAVTRMWDADIGWLPVVDGGKVIGTVTDRDACVAACTRGRRLDDLTVDSVMSPDPVTCPADETVEHALATMRMHQVRRLPVVDERDQLIGVITLGDLARDQAAHPARPGRTDEIVTTLAAIESPPTVAN
jgi:CBS domain-containing protein